MVRPYDVWFRRCEFAGLRSSDSSRSFGCGNGGIRAVPALCLRSLHLIVCVVAQCASAKGEETVRILDEQPYAWECCLICEVDASASLSHDGCTRCKCWDASHQHTCVMLLPRERSWLGHRKIATARGYHLIQWRTHEACAPVSGRQCKWTRSG